MYIQVAVARKLSDHQDLLTYHVPEHLCPQVKEGTLVIVPMGRGNQEVQGYVMARSEEVPHATYIAEEYKDILSVAASETFLNKELVDLALWISQYYLCPCYYVLEYMLPKFARSKKEEIVVWHDESALSQAQMVFLDPSASQMAQTIRKNGKVPIARLYKQYSNAAQSLHALLEAGLVHMETTYARTGGNKTETVYESCVSPEQLEQVKHTLGRAAKQWEVLRYLTYQGASNGKTLRGYWSNYLPLVKALEEKQLICSKKVEISRIPQDTPTFRNQQELELNAEQQHALDAILRLVDSLQMEWALLHGVTGSGKTEVYLRTLRYVLEQGKGAMILVPEISLTPQLIGRFRAALGETVEVLHSNLSDGERFDAWQRLYRGETRVVVGVRSAVFAPVKNLGLIIMDEEHESTFKQSEPDPRYHTREVARYRMEQNHGLLLLGSATPSVETYYNIAKTGGTLLTMHHRAQHQPMPQVEIVNMAREFQTGNRSMFSGRLVQTMEESLQNGEQVILFLNRRGFSSAILCRECGHTVTCEKCSIALTYHKEQQLAKCHYCDYMEPVPSKCPACGSRFIRYMGSGTELVEAEVKKRWPWIRTERMDLDTTQNKNAHTEILERFARGETQVLIGTQMVAKGLDFPNVTTVGVLSADMILNLPDYTASERTFQLLTQVAGRAGRGEKPGQVIIQTYNPEHYSLQSAQAQDYQQFYQKELQMRRLMEYPPFSHMVRILLSDYTEDGLLDALRYMSDQIAAQYPEVEFLGPAVAPIAIIRKRHRVHVILKGPSLAVLREAAEYGQKVMNLSRKSKTLRILIDVEPANVL